MESFRLNVNGMMDIHPLVDGMKEWMSHIEIDKDKYAIEIMPGFDQYPLYGRVAIKYENEVLFFINFYQKYGKSKDGHKCIHGMFSVRVQNEGADLLKGERITLNVNDRLGADYPSSNSNIVKALCELLPIRDEEKVKRISSAFNIDANHIKFDTYRKRYVIDIPLKDLSFPQKEAPQIYHKYMSLSTFHKILANRSFRMHSIVSQSDVTESLYLGDLLSADYENDTDRFKGVLKEKDVLISSFTDKYDDSYMWEHYGDHGKGVCISFRTLDSKPLTRVHYLDKTYPPIEEYRKQAVLLKKDGIRVHFKASDSIRRFVKDWKYFPEQEWRLVLENQTGLQTDVYADGRMVLYKDFPIEGTLLKDADLQITSVLIGPCQIKDTNNYPILVDRIFNVFGDHFIVNPSRCSFE